jgi:CRP/FNR family transcriptional regulator, cyclic AMP receptor protein
MMIDIDLLLSLGATYKKIKAGEVVFMEGAPCNFYHQLVTGGIKWVNIDENGKEFLQWVIAPGECFGEIPLFDDGPFVATAIATEDAIVVRIHRSTFKQLISENPALHFTFSKLLAERVRFKFYLLKELANHNPEHRINALIDYFKTHNNKSICCECSQVKLTRQQIADMTGLRVETVIRSIRHMHDRGEIFIDKGKVYLGGMTQIIKKPGKD